MHLCCRLCRIRGIGKTERNPKENKGSRLTDMSAHKKSRNDNHRVGGRPRRITNPRQRARIAVGNAVKLGGLVKPAVCEICGKGPVQAHHYRGYAKRYWLTVKWLCADCHREADKEEQRETEKAQGLLLEDKKPFCWTA